MQFGEKLVLLREKHNMSQEELAEKLDVTRQTISNWENGKVAIDANKAVEICRLFSVDMNYLFLDSTESAVTHEPTPDKTNVYIGAKNRLLIIIGCIVVTLALVATFIVASICLSHSNDAVSSTITLSYRAALIILVVVCVLSIILIAAVLLVTLLKRK